MSVNEVRISGGLTRDAEAKYVGEHGTALMTFTVAVNGTRYDSAARQQVVKTTYVSVEAWAVLAERLMNTNLMKGDEVLVVGELAQTEREKRDGTKETKTRVVAFTLDVLRLGAAHRAAEAGQDPEPGAATDGPLPADDDGGKWFG